MTISSIHKNIVNIYKKIEQITKEKPITAIIYSIAMKMLAILFTTFSKILGFSVFMLSLPFDIAFIANPEVCSKIKDIFFKTIGRLFLNEDFDGYNPAYLRLQKPKFDGYSSAYLSPRRF